MTNQKMLEILKDYLAKREHPYAGLPGAAFDCPLANALQESSDDCTWGVARKWAGAEGTPYINLERVLARFVELVDGSEKEITYAKACAYLAQAEREQWATDVSQRDTSEDVTAPCVLTSC